jgi:hypothetical protein
MRCYRRRVDLDSNLAVVSRRRRCCCDTCRAAVGALRCRLRYYGGILSRRGRLRVVFCVCGSFSYYLIRGRRSLVVDLISCFYSI